MKTNNKMTGDEVTTLCDAITKPFECYVERRESEGVLSYRHVPENPVVIWEAKTHQIHKYFGIRDAVMDGWRAV